ncbi:hypothetical protein [Paraclostridium benzoelyticum]|nr:hypothetical protein [Paraclostridium benzoelyticum]
MEKNVISVDKWRNIMEVQNVNTIQYKNIYAKKLGIFKFENDEQKTEKSKSKEYNYNTTDGKEYLMKLAGNDDLGNKVEFYCDYSNNGKGIFKLDNSHKRIKKVSSKLKLSLYASDSSNNKWKKVG